MNVDKHNKPKFAQLYEFASELLLLLVNEKNEEVEKICEEIEAGTITNYFYNKYSFKNINSSLEAFADVNSIMKSKYVSQKEAENRCLEQNGIAYLIQLIWDDVSKNLYDMKFNDIDPDNYRFDD